MSSVFWTIGPILTLIVLTVVPVGAFLRLQKHKRRHRRSPLVRDLLRGPGESLRRELDEVFWDVALHLSLLLALPFLVYSVYLSKLHYAGAIDGTGHWLVSGVLLLAGIAYVALRLGKLARRRFLVKSPSGIETATLDR